MVLGRTRPEPGSAREQLSQSKARRKARASVLAQVLLPAIKMVKEVNTS